MNRHKGCIFGLLQLGAMFCITGSLLIGIIGISLWQETNEKHNIWWRIGRSRRLPTTVEAPLAYKIIVPTTVGPTKTNTPESTSILKIPVPTPTATSAAIPTVMPETPTSSVSSFIISSPSPSPPPSQPVPTATSRPTSLPELPSAAIANWPEVLATRLVIPALEMDVPVVLSPISGQTWAVNHLAENIGHLERTASPGANSNVVLAAHVTLAPDGRAGPFVNLVDLIPGDLVTVYSGPKPYTYRVDHLTTVKPSDIEITYPSNEAKLTLITCLNYNSSLRRYEDRLVVVGYLVSEN